MKIGPCEVKKKVLTGIAVAVIGVLLMLGLPIKQVFAESARIGVSRDIKTALIYVADSQGFFKKQGIDVVVKEYELGVLAVNDLTAGRIDIATGSEFVFVSQSLRYPFLRMPTTICIASDQELVVRKDRGILKPQDLKGKRVAVIRSGQTEFFLNTYLLFNLKPAGSVRVVYHTPSEMVKAMADGTIDAALCWPPYSTEMMKLLGANGSRWPAQNGQEYYFTLFTNEDFLRKQPKTMERFLAALLEAELFIAKYPQETKSILQQRFGVDAATLLEAWSHVRFKLQLTQDLIVLMEREAKWAIRNKIIDAKKMPNYLNFIYFDALDKVKPEAVSIVH